MRERVQPDALSKDWSSQSDPKRALTSSSQVKADHGSPTVCLPRARARERVAPISELVFEASTKNQSSLEASLGVKIHAAT